MTLIRQFKLQDATLATVQATVLTTGAVSVNDSDANTKLTDIETAINAIETNQNDKTQFTKITDGTDDLAINASGEASVIDKATGTVSADNSTSTLLNASATFTGEWEDVSRYNSVVVAVKTDQNGSFTIQFSPDGTNADSTLTRYYRTSQIEAPHRFTITRQYCRVTFTNDSASNQTYLRLQTMYGDRSDLNAPIDSTLAQDFDAIATRPTDFHTEVALSRRQGATTWNKFGYNDDIDTASAEIIAEFGGTFQYLTSGETIDIVSSSTNDDLIGTGVQRIIIWGVDENWEEQTEIVEMDGTTTVTTSSQWIGINRVSIYKAGTGLKNDGTLTITATTSGYNMASMPTGQGTTQQMIFYVPASHQFLAEWLYFNALKVSGGGGNPEVTLKGWVYSAVATAEFEIYRDGIDVQDSQHLNISPPVPFVVGEKSILWFTCATDTNNTAVRGRFSGELIRDVDA